MNIYLGNTFPQITPEQEAKVAEQLLYLIIALVVVGIVITIYGTLKRWDYRVFIKIAIPTTIIFMFVGGIVILRAPWWFVLQITILVVLAYIGWAVSVPKIRQAFLNLFDKKRKE